MERLTVETGTFEVNTSILSIDGKAWFVDPGSDAARLVALMENKGLEPGAILLTHAHFDHIGAVPGLQDRFPDIPVYVHPADLQIISHPMNQMPPDYPSIGIPRDIRDCRELTICEVIETPGHTPGGVCYFFNEEKLLLSGDTLFAGSIGRTDLPLGDAATLMKSLEKLKKLPEDTLVIPGHGYHTTIGGEKKSNPFLCGGTAM
jgi:glyoxylase-like metal-dependent hydrolase (beta-lactamase superfamily II)